jgi:hypothetical protein
MVMNLPVLEIDGIDFRGHGFNAVTRSGRYRLPARRGENLVLPGASGSTFVPNKPYEVGVGTLSIFVLGASTSGENIVIPATHALRQAQFETNMATVMRLFTRSHRLSTIRAAAPDGSIRRALVEWKEWGEPEIQAGGTRAEFSITYEIPGVWWEDESATTQSAGASATSPKNFDLTSFANMTGVIEDAKLQVTGQITNPRITDPATGSYIQYTGTVAAGSTWWVDVAAATSKVGTTAGGEGAAASVMANTVHVGGYKLFTIPNEYNGTNTPRLVLTGTSLSAANNLTVVARRKWATG